MRSKEWEDSKASKVPREALGTSSPFPRSPKEISADQRGQVMWLVLHSMAGCGVTSAPGRW